jgi:hypothetical protein
MEEEDFELLVQAVQDYKEKCETLQAENDTHLQSIAQLKLDLVEVRNSEKESIQIITDLEQTVCILDKELLRANESLAAAEEECALLSCKHDGGEGVREGKRRSPRGVEHDHSQKTLDVDADIDKLERKLLEAVTNYKDLLLENKELAEIISFKQIHEKELNDEIAQLTSMLRSKDMELNQKDAEITLLRTRNDMTHPRSSSAMSDSDRSLGSRQNSLAAAYGSPAIEAGDAPFDHSKKDRSTSFEDYVDWRKTQSESEEKARAKLRGALFGPSPELAPLVVSGSQTAHKPSPATPPPKGSAAFHDDESNTNLTRTTSDSTSASYSKNKKSMPPMSPPAALDLSQINLTPKRHSYAGSSPSTASSSLSSPYPSWNANQSVHDKTPKFNSLYDSDSEDVQVSPLPVRRRQQSRSLNSFQDMFGYNSNRSAEKINPKQPALITAKTVSELISKPSKAESLRDVSSSADSGGEEAAHQQRPSGGPSKQLYRSNTTLPVVANPNSTTTSSSRWASMGRHHNKIEEAQFDITDDHSNRQETKEEDRFEILDSDPRSGGQSVQVTRGCGVTVMHASSVLPSIDGNGDKASTGHHLKRQSPSNDHQVAVTKSGSGTSLLAGLVAGKGKRTIIPMGGKHGSI